MLTQSKNESKIIINENQLIIEFDNYLSIYKDVADSTIQNHHVYIRRFFEWFHKEKFLSIEDVNFENLNIFLSLYHHQYSLSSSRKLHFSLRAFFEYCRLHKIIKLDFRPILPQKRVYYNSYVPAILTDEKIGILIENCKKDISKKGIRDYAMLLLLICYGIRGCQVRNLECSDIDWEANKIYFKGSKKGNGISQSIIPEVGNSLVNYICNIRPKSTSEKVFLSMKHSNKELTSSSALSAIIRNILDNSGIKMPYNSLKGSHIFRHSFASRLLSKGEPIKNISDMLGHKDYDTTIIYTKIDIENLKKVCLEWEEY